MEESPFDIEPKVRHLTKRLELPIEVARSYAEFEEMGHRRCILFVYAAWSGPAVAGLSKVVSCLSGMDTAGLSLIVLDNDGITLDQMKRFAGRVFEGWGETFWLLDDEVQAEVLSGKKEGAEASIIRETAGLSRHGS